MKRAVISITDACVLNCLHCYNMYRGHVYSADYFDEGFVKQLQSIGIQQIVLSGGEPVLVWDLLLSIIRIINQRFSVVITSNGVLLNAEKVLELKKNGVSRLQISLDGVSPLSHEYLRGPGTYNHAYDLVRSYPEFITPMFTIHAKNYHEVGPFIEQQIHNGIKKIGFERFIPIKGNDNNKYLELSKNQLFSAYSVIAEYKDVDFHINDPLYNTYLLIKNKVSTSVLTGFSNLGCEALNNNIYINANGDVYPCVFSDEILFNVHTKPLSKCYDFSCPKITGCYSCEYYCVCKGCRAAAKYQYGDWLEIDPLCPLH